MPAQCCQSENFAHGFAVYSPRNNLRAQAIPSPGTRRGLWIHVFVRLLPLLFRVSATTSRSSVLVMTRCLRISHLIGTLHPCATNHTARMCGGAHGVSSLLGLYFLLKFSTRKNNPFPVDMNSTVTKAAAGTPSLREMYFSLSVCRTSYVLFMGGRDRRVKACVPNENWYSVLWTATNG